MTILQATFSVYYTDIHYFKIASAGRLAIVVVTSPPKHLFLFISHFKVCKRFPLAACSFWFYYDFLRTKEPEINCERPARNMPLLKAFTCCTTEGLYGLERGNIEFAGDLFNHMFNWKLHKSDLKRDLGARRLAEAALPQLVRLGGSTFFTFAKKD